MVYINLVNRRKGAVARTDDEVVEVLREIYRSEFGGKTGQRYLIAWSDLRTIYGFGKLFESRFERLVEAGVVTRNDIGRSAAYQLDQRLAVVQTVLLPLFRAEAKLHERLLGAIARGCTKLKPRPHAVVVFGSAARGARDFRDVDLLCIAAREGDKALIHDGVGDAFDHLQREFKVPVSMVVATRGELGTAKLQAVTREARRDGVLMVGMAPAELSGLAGWERPRGIRK